MRRALFTDTTERNLYMYQVDNAIIMAAGASSRFAPLSVEYPKALIEVRGEVLIERQIKQLQQAGIGDIYVVVGYMGHCFDYLQEKLGVHIVKNDAYLYRNNNSSIYAVKDIIKNSYICSADNYFTQNPFTDTVEESYYAAVYADGETAEWCMQEDQNGYITDVQVGGRGSWYMLGHVFWSEEFSRKFSCDFEERLLKEDFHTESAENPDAIYFKGTSVDLGEIVLNNIILNLPLKNLCKDDCQGLCPVCGKNLNHGGCDCDSRTTDPRFDILDKLL